MKNIRKLINQYPVISVSAPFVVLGIFWLVSYLPITKNALDNQATIYTPLPEPSKEGLSDEEYVGIAQRLYVAKQTGTIVQELKTIEDKYGYPPPTSFIDGDFDPDFLDYFENNTYSFWKTSNTNRSDFSFQIFHENNGIGKFSIVAWPYIEGWDLIGKADRIAFLVLAKGNNDFGPLLRFKATPQSEIFEYQLSEPIAEIFPLDFYDYDGDGQPEVGLRYTVTGADGFWQYFTIFKIDGDKLNVFRNFPSNEEGRGSEGIARRVGNTIEVGSAFSGDNSSGHLGFDKYLIEKYQFKGGDFIKVGEQIIPHPLLSTSWKNYFRK